MIAVYQSVGKVSEWSPSSTMYKAGNTLAAGDFSELAWIIAGTDAWQVPSFQEYSCSLFGEGQCPGGSHSLDCPYQILQPLKTQYRVHNIIIRCSDLLIFNSHHNITSYQPFIVRMCWLRKSNQSGWSNQSSPTSATFVLDPPKHSTHTTYHKYHTVQYHLKDTMSVPALREVEGTFIL